MHKELNDNRIKAFDIYRENRGKITSKEIANILDEKLSNINYWRQKDKWAKKLKGGAPLGNKNALGNKGGAPEGNINGFKHGAYISEDRFKSKDFLAKYLPRATGKIINDISDSCLSSLDMLWSSITLKYAAIIRSQKIMNVKSKSEISKTLKREKISPGKWGDTVEKEYEVQLAWDRQERFLKAQAISMRELTNMIKQYEDLLHKNWDLASEEQRLRIDKLKGEVDKIKGNDNKEPIKIEFVKGSKRDD